MYTSFEQFAAASMQGERDAPPRSNGELLFQRPWEGRAFGMAIALSKKGHYEWEDFRQQLISSIVEWDEKYCKEDHAWDYYQRWLLALERLLVESRILNYEELGIRTREFLARQQGAV